MIDLVEDEDDLDYDYDYEDFDEIVGEEFAKDILEILNDLIDMSDIMEEDFISTKCLSDHFRKHCLGKDIKRRSTRTNVYYDFKDNSQYREYEKHISEIVNKTDYTIGSLDQHDLIMKYFTKLFEGNVAVEFCNSCGLQNKNGKVSLSVIAYSSDVTTNYTNSNTIDVCIKGKGRRTITLYPIDAHELEKKLNRIFKKYGGYSGNNFAINND